MSSSMLEQAVIDAQSLREAALKSAEQEVLNKYSTEIKETMDKLLEQEDEGPSMDMMGGEVERDEIVDEIPMKAVGGEDLCPCPDDDEEVELDLDALKAAVDAEDEPMMEVETEEAPLEEEELMFEATEEELLSLLSEDENIEEELKNPDKADLNKDGKLSGYEKKRGAAIEKSMAADDKEDKKEKNEAVDKEEEGEALDAKDVKEELEFDLQELLDLEEEVEINEDEIKAALEEILKVDVENVPRGDLGTTHPTKAQQVHAVEVAAAQEADTEVSEEEDKLQKMIDDLQEQVSTLKVENNNLQKQHNELKSVALQASKKFEEINLSNAKLNYINRILKSDSLNERQKENIVEKISGANTITESKFIFETVSESLSSGTPKAPKNLKEALNKNSTLVLKSNNKEQASSSKSTVDRMKRLAGII
jgi:DNA repair exonuclease SbcCD ATPase subunit